jgi:xanthine dehydrogenase YagT iron-sulfur-binding subunit
METTVSVTVDGERRTARIDTRVTLLDLLRERLGVIAPKKGCDHGQCGSCTVLLNGRRVTSCLAFAVQHDGAQITTAAGAGTTEAPHPVQQAFLDHDAFQCGYCTPGQICSAIGMLAELEAGWPSHASPDVATEPQRTPAEIRERMSGNLCRCGAYVGILAAIEQAAS